MTVRVIICSHNGVRYIEEQLASIMAQRRSVDIVHLFDFDSQDGTRDLLERLSRRWSNLHVETVDHAPGVVGSFFHAFQRVADVSGPSDLIFLSDQDDVWAPDKTEVVLEHLATSETGPGDLVLAFHDVVLCNADLTAIRGSFYDDRPFLVPRDLAADRLLIANPVIGHTIAINKKTLDVAVRCLRPDDYIMHDWALVLLVAHLGTIVPVPRQLGLYRQHESNVLGAGRRRTLADYVRRGLRLSALVRAQTSTFIEDLRCAEAMTKITPRHAPLAGKAPIPLQLAGVLALRGHSLGHRLMALGQIGALFDKGRSS